jgi:Ca-activated chloride channel family protein
VIDTRSGILLLLLWALPAQATDVIFHGKVVRDDGSPLGHMVTVQRVCEGEGEPVREGVASPRTGEYNVRLDVDAFSQTYASFSMVPVACMLEVYDQNFVSSQIDLSDRSIVNNPRLPDIVLTPRTRTTALGNKRDPNAPRAVSRNWKQAVNLVLARNWAAAETPMRTVVERAPKFAPGWSALGILYSNLGKPKEARQALERAIELDPRPLSPYMGLTTAETGLKDWKAAAVTARTLIAADRKHVYIEANLMLAVALYQLREFDHALAAVHDAMRLDKLHQLPRAEYMEGLILEAKGDLSGAGQHLRNYIQQHPHAKDAAVVNDRLANLGKAPLPDLAAEIDTLDLRAATAGESPVPGGIKAFSAVAQLKGDPGYDDFFLDYARGINHGGAASGGAALSGATRDATDEIRSFIATVTALEALGEHHDEGTSLRLSLDSDEHVRKTREILAQSGWKLVSKGDQYSLEPGDGADDGLRQWSLVCLGVDEVALKQAMRQKREFTFEIPRENARLIGGAAWGVLLKGVPDLPGGPIEIFSRDWRFPRVYSGLAAMDNETAGAVVSAIGLNNLIVKYSRLMADFGDSITLAGPHVIVPGGAKAEPAWAKLAGAKPESPAPFLRALFDKDQGRLLAFYFDVFHADLPRQEYITGTADRAEAFYNWYRDSMPASGAPATAERWQATILQKIIQPSGKVNFPGGAEAWGAGADDSGEILLHRAPGLASIRELASISELQDKRGAPFTAAAARLLVQHQAEWRNLFPYFEKLAALEGPEFTALAAFGEDAEKAAPERRNVLLGDWHSLVELTVLGRQAGAISNSQAAQFFREACEVMRSPNPSARVIEILHAMVGGAADLDEAVPGQLLRLTGARLEAFEAIRRMQNVPSFASLNGATTPAALNGATTPAALGNSPDGATTLAALSGSVYGAVLDPAYLLVAEDPQLLSKHSFIPVENPEETIFGRSRLKISNSPPGSYFQGGFGDFQTAAQALRKQIVGPLLAPPVPDNAPAGPAGNRTHSDNPPFSGSEAAPIEAEVKEPVFKADGRIVEVYATVTDSRGRYVDDLNADQFSVLEQGHSKPVFAFEDRNAAVSVALLFDTTASMVNTLPLLKAAAMQLVDDLRPTDSAAVYTFSDSVNENQPFTTDKDAARRAILKTHAVGDTALYDALVRVNRDLSSRGGKKVIIVFTDGSDNASMLTSAVSIERAKSSGIPIYTIVEGAGLEEQKLMGELARISQATGGSQFPIHRLSDIAPVFEKVSQELMHGYLLAFQPSPGNNHEWRPIEVVPEERKGLQIRAREGFYVE